MAKASKLPSNLAFTGTFSVTTGVMSGADADGNVIGPVEVQEKTIRGTLSNAKQAKDVNNQTKLEHANIQRVDTAELPVGADHLLVEYSLKVTPNLWRPASCNEKAFRDNLDTYVRTFTEKGGMKTLARLYVEQMLSDEWLWRNKDALSIQITATGRARGIDDIVVKRDVLDGTGDSIDPLVDLVADVMENQRRVAFIRLKALVELERLAEVYPSQEFVDGESGQGSKSKTLFVINTKDNKRQAAMHSQKLGNALRRIDNWHGDASGRTIAVEMYGVDQERHAAYRKKDNSFYDYLRDLPGLIASLEEEGVSDEHLYFTACLVRGGVFGE